MSVLRPPHVLVVVPCHNEARYIGRKIENTLALRYRERTIVIVDDYSTDATAEVAARFASRGVVVLKNVGPAGKNTAVATALRALPSDLVCLTDADVLVGPHALGQLVDRLRAEGAVGVCGSARTVEERAWLRGDVTSSRRGAAEIVQHLLRRMESRLDSLVGPHGQLLLLERTGDIWIEPGTRCDDVELAFRLRAAGGRVVYAPEASFYEAQPPTARARFRQKRRRAAAVLRAFLRHRDVLFNRRYGAFGLIAFPIEFALYFVQPLLLLALVGATLLRVGPHPALLGALGVGAVLPPIRAAAMANVALLAALLRGGSDADRWSRTDDEARGGGRDRS